MSEKELNKQLESTQQLLEEAKRKLRLQMKIDKAERIRLNEKIGKAKNQILSKNENLFQSSILTGGALIISLLSAVLAGSTSLLALLISVGFGCMAITTGIIGACTYKSKLKAQKQLLGLEKDLQELSLKSEELDNIEQELSGLYNERKYILEKLIEIEKDEAIQKKDIEILKAIKKSEKSSKYVGEEYDASNESLLNYQKSLHKKQKKDKKDKNNDLTK